MRRTTTRWRTTSSATTAVPQQVKAKVWCPKWARFTQNMSPNPSLKLEAETLHEVVMDVSRKSIMIIKDPFTAKNKRSAVDNSNCPDMGASITILGKNLMKKMGLMVNKDKMSCSVAEKSTFRELGFIPVRLKVKGQDGETHKTNKCLYFPEGFMTTLVSLRVL